MKDTTVQVLQFLVQVGQRTGQPEDEYAPFIQSRSYKEKELFRKEPIWL